MRLPVGAQLATAGYQASGTMYRSEGTHPCCGLAGLLMVNKCEPVINLVIPLWRNALLRHAKWQAGRGWFSSLTIPPFVDPPGKIGYLKAAMKVEHLEHGKPVHLHAEDTWYVVRKEDGWMGRQRNQEEANAIL